MDSQLESINHYIAKPTDWRRWWVYQQERFPLAQHAPLIFVFSASAVCFSSLLRRSPVLVSVSSFLVAFVCCLLFFLQLRLADEFKDYEEDSRYRPYRAVPRGLVSLRELAWLWLLTAIIQFSSALLLAPSLLIVLGITWAYLLLMTQEFFVRNWVKKRPIVYMASHMLIIPLIDLFATACDWAVTAGSPPIGLGWFLTVSFFNGFVIEIGRKTRASGDEEEGVETYSRLYGIRGAIAFWWLMLGVTFLAALIAASAIDFVVPVASIVGITLLTCFVHGVRFAAHPSSRGAKQLEVMSGLWVLMLYLSLGILPAALSLYGVSI